MNSFELKAKAKINLSIDVLGKREDGYHNVKMIMQSIGLHDDICIEKRGAGIELQCQCPWVPVDRKNTAYKAAELLIDKYGIKDGIRIVIRKNIPVAAGLAGGSTDAAAVLRGMNEMFSLGLEEASLMALGKQVGADVPYCIKGGTVLAEGIGEVLTELEPLPVTDIVLVKPRISVSTAWVYKNINFDKIKKRPDTDLLISAIRESRTDIVSKNMVNVLETVTIQRYGVIERIKKRLLELGAEGSIMSGSGPTVFGIFNSSTTARNAYDAIKNEKWDSFLTETDNPTNM